MDQKYNNLDKKKNSFVKFLYIFYHNKCLLAITPFTEHNNKPFNIIDINGITVTFKDQCLKK